MKFASTQGEWALISVCVFSIFVVQFFDDGRDNLFVHMRDLEIIYMPRDGYFFAIYDFVGYTPIVWVDDESPFNKSGGYIFQKRRAACRVPYSAFFSFTYMTGRPFSVVVYFVYNFGLIFFRMLTTSLAAWSSSSFIQPFSGSTLSHHL